MALAGVRVIELSGLAPAPFCGMLLSDFGASVIRIDKTNQNLDIDCLGNGKRSLQLNLKSNKGVKILKTLVKQSDVLIEPFRPGVMEKIGLGPDVLMAENNKLIYARLSGFSSKGPMAARAGHDINFVAMSGLLSIIGGTERVPVPPVNFAADFAGGGLLCAFGIVMALHERNKSGLGQIVNSNMTSGAAYAGSWLFRSRLLPIWTGPRGTNVLDGGTHYYCCYETKDSKFMAVGAIEPQFYSEFIQGLGLEEDELPQFIDQTQEAKARIQKIFKNFSQEHWIKVFENTDACVTPVLDASDIAALDNNCFTHNNGVYAPSPSPELSRTPAVSQATKPHLNSGEDTLEVMEEAGYSKQDIEEFLKAGVISTSKL